MHIPDHMLQGAVCPVAAAVSVAGLGAALIAAARCREKPDALSFAAVSALIFAAQMMNFPIRNGTSGHLLGGILTVSLLGIPYGVLAIALVLTIQCFLFADGGLSVLGANILNMAVIGAGAAGFFNRFLCRGISGKSLNGLVRTGFSAWLSVMAAAFACSIELAAAGVIPFSRVAPAMLGTHAWIALGEGILTAVCVAFLPEFLKETNRQKATGWVGTACGAVVLALLSPFASSFPDGLEWVAEKHRFLHESQPLFVSPLPDYSVSFVSHESLATAFAGLIGIAVVFALAWMISKGLRRMAAQA